MQCVFICALLHDFFANAGAILFAKSKISQAVLKIGD